MSSQRKSSTVSDAFPTVVLAIVVAVVIYSLASNHIVPAADCPTGGSIVVGRGLRESREVSTHSIAQPVSVYRDHLDYYPYPHEQEREEQPEREQRDQ